MYAYFWKEITAAPMSRKRPSKRSGQTQCRWRIRVPEWRGGEFRVAPGFTSVALNAPICVFKKRLIFKILNAMNLYTSGCAFVYVNTSACGGQKKVLRSLDLQVQVVAGCLTWVPEADVGDSGRAMCALKDWGVSPASLVKVLKIILGHYDIMKPLDFLPHVRVRSEPGLCHS